MQDGEQCRKKDIGELRGLSARRSDLEGLTPHWNNRLSLIDVKKTAVLLPQSPAWQDHGVGYQLVNIRQPVHLPRRANFLCRCGRLCRPRDSFPILKRKKMQQTARNRTWCCAFTSLSLWLQGRRNRSAELNFWSDKHGLEGQAIPEVSESGNSSKSKIGETQFARRGYDSAVSARSRS